MRLKTKNRSLILYKVLIGLKFALIFLPQTAVIHPDEFFQSVEISAGNIFRTETVQTWEFTSERPIRSCIMILITSLPFCILKGLSTFLNENFQFSITSSYILLILPRIIMAFLSLTIDYSLYNIVKLLSISNEPLLVLATSYVSVVYYTRTLSNTLEAALFALLLLLVLKSLQHCEKSGHLLNSWFSINLAITAVTIVGIFNRPTFIVFAVTPVCTWFYKEIIVMTSLRYVPHKLLIILINSLLITSFLILLDTFYYSGNSFMNCINLDSELIWRSIIVTPWNFFKYNVNPDNLANHGLHPYWLHFIVNFQILHGPVGFLAIMKLIDVYLKGSTISRSTKFVNCFFVMSLIVPLILLSLIPHQEPRFLIPLLIIVALLFGKSIWRSSWIRFGWLFFNFVGILFYGFIHQGGIVSSLQSLSNRSANTSGAQVIFFHTYMPPTYLLKVPLQPMKINVTDLAGSSVESLQTIISQMQLHDEKEDIYLLSPGSLHCSISDLRNKYNLVLLERFYLHLSTEDLPKIGQCDLQTNDFISSALNIFNQLSLNLYQIKIIRK